MVCPFCLHKKTSIYNSRPTKRINGTWRRRRCDACGKEFTTRETIDPETILQVLSNKEKKPFLRSTLILSLIRICDHRQDDAVYWLAETIEQKLLTIAAANNDDFVISKQQIIETCLSTLKHFDTPAFVKYLSYHSPSLDARSLKKQLRK